MRNCPRRSPACLVWTFALLVLGAAGCGPLDVAPPEETRIGFLVDMTTPIALATAKAARLAVVDSFQGSVVARFARQDLGLTSVAPLYDMADTYSRGLSR